MERDKRVVLITGASRGLGLAVAKTLIERGRYRLVLTAREASLSRFAEAGIVPSDDVGLCSLDVARHEEREAVVEYAAERFGGVDVLINNAGTMTRAVVEHVSDADHLRQMRVNYHGPMELSRLCLPGMRERGRGHIINVSSVGGMMAMPTMSVYSASKFALEGASEALYYEVRPWNVFVTLVEPGFIDSGAIERVVYTDRSRAAAENPHSPYHAHYANMAVFIAQIMRRTPSTPTSVARTILRVLDKKCPPLRVAGTLDARIFSILRRILPRGLYHEVLYRALPQVASWGPRTKTKK